MPVLRADINRQPRIRETKAQYILYRLRTTRWTRGTCTQRQRLLVLHFTFKDKGAAAFATDLAPQPCERQLEGRMRASQSRFGTFAFECFIPSLLLCFTFLFFFFFFFLALLINHRRQATLSASFSSCSTTGPPRRGNTPRSVNFGACYPGSFGVRTPRRHGRGRAH